MSRRLGADRPANRSVSRATWIKEIPMKLLTGLLALAFSLAILARPPAEAADPKYGKQKVVYHINYVGGPDSKRYRGALRNVQNHINAIGVDNIEVRIVLHGRGVGLLMRAKKDQKLQQAVTSLKTQNVSFSVCNNTLVGGNLSYEDDLFEVFDDDIVPSGVAEVSYLQQQGFTYIKP